jgi:hypothetical protein
MIKKFGFHKEGEFHGQLRNNLLLKKGLSIHDAAQFFSG